LETAANEIAAFVRGFRVLKAHPPENGQTRQLEPQLRQMKQETVGFSNPAVCLDRQIFVAKNGER
jgi:hypothetical protein